MPKRNNLASCLINRGMKIDVENAKDAGISRKEILNR
jgi:hypothetical protein